MSSKYIVPLVWDQPHIQNKKSRKKKKTSPVGIKSYTLSPFPTVGGQKPNNIALPLHRLNFKILGTSPEMIDSA